MWTACSPRILLRTELISCGPIVFSVVEKMDKN